MWFEILKFEIQYRAKRADTYLYFGILFLFSIIASEFIMNGSSTIGKIKINAPFVIASVMGIVTSFFTMVISMIMGVAALRDFDHKMESLIFINPIKKRDYLLGRFLGSYLVLVFIFSGLFFGMMLGDLVPWPWRDMNNLLPFDFWNYLKPFLFLVLPNLFFCGAIFFVSGALSRKLMVVYTQGVLLLMIYIFTMQLTRNAENQFVAAILDPFTFQATRIITQLWTPVEINSQTIPLGGILFYNRLIWIALGIVILVIGHYRFSFNVIRKNSFKKSRLSSFEDLEIVKKDFSNIKITSITLHNNFKTKLQQLVHQSFFYFKIILTEVPFWAIVICGGAIIFGNSIGLRTSYGVDSFPTTYIIVEDLQEMSIFFFLLIILFYSGELIWKERDVKFNGIFDALATSDFINLAGKFIGLILSYVVIILALIFSGIIFQTLNGYYDYEIGLYFSLFFLGIFPFLVLFTFVAFFFQVLTNHKFLGHIMVVIFIFLSMFLLPVLLKLNHGLLIFGGSGLAPYSDMNGFGHFLSSYIWLKIYWLTFSFLMFLIAVVFTIRGTETQFAKRWKLSKFRWTPSLRKLSFATILIFGFSGSYIFYNTNVLNFYWTVTTQKTYRANYEKTLKQFEHLPQPKIIDVNLKVDLFPSKRNFTAEGYFILKNTHPNPIDKIHIQTVPHPQFSMEYVKIEDGAKLNNEHEKFNYKIFELNQPLQPNDSIKLEFKQVFISKGFIEDPDFQILHNGTFIQQRQFPTIGYNEDIELEEENDRADFDLKPKLRRAKRDDPLATLDGRSDEDGEEINFEIVLGTDLDQIAIAPGYLQKEWTENDRKYFHYKMDKPMSNFYSIVSARYEVKRDQWIPSNDSLGEPVDLEIFYQKGHEYNLDRMMNGMKKSFDYFSQHFGAYQYRQMRILEFPNYDVKAQSFPNTVPFSEGIGFILDIDEEEDIDMAFFVTAHELSHQWWGHQVNAANVQGKGMILESLAQYSAIMAMEKEFSEEKIQQFLRQMRDRYLKGRTQEKIQEMPLTLVESGQDYIHYGKGLVNLYAFQDYISEDSLNLALRRFIRDWDSFTGLKRKNQYPTTIDLIGYFREVTPDSLQYVIEDLFETITIYNNTITKVECKKSLNDNYKINLVLKMEKLRVDSLGIENPIQINDWIDVGIYSKNREGEEQLVYLEKHKITNQEMNLELMVEEKPTKVGIDPTFKLIDRNLEDNFKIID
ncbi:MAG: M1 family aminopeptidase [Saprospiraceae bacterium]